MMYQRLLNLSQSNSFFLFGARGTGKSSLLRARFGEKDALWIVLLDPELAASLDAFPNRFVDLVRGQKRPWVVVDEIQKIPKLLDLVQQMLLKKEVHFALTGSSARKLKRGASNLLAGRAFVFTLFPMTHIELAETFDLQKALEFGTLPESWNHQTDLDRRRFLKSYATTFIKEEIVAEQLVRNLAPFRRFLEVAAQSNGEMVNYSNIAKDVDSDAKTISNYYEILEDTLVAMCLPSFSHSIRKRQKKAKKFYFLDTGVTRALAGVVDVSLSSKTVEYGRQFESFIINEVHRLLSYEEKQFQLSFLNVGNQQEIDLIVERPGCPTFLCEIKSTDRVDDRAGHHLDSLGRDFKNAKQLIISNDPISKKFNSSTALHWRQALRAIVAGSL